MSAIFWRDLRLAIGSGGGFGQGLAFFTMVLFLIILAIGPSTDLLSQIAPSVIFICVLLAGLLSIDRMFKMDDDDGSLPQLRLSPVPLSSVVIAKALVHYLTTGFAMTLLVPVFGLMLGLNASSILSLVIALLIGAPAMSFLGAIGAALTLSIKRSSLIQALVTMPLYIPTLIYGSMAAVASPRQNAALLLLFGLSLIICVLSPWVSAKIIERNNI